MDGAGRTHYLYLITLLYYENVKNVLYRVSKKAERLIYSTLQAKSVVFFTSLNEASSAEEIDTKIIEFGRVILILCPFLEMQSFSDFAWCLRPLSVELYREGLSYGVLGKPIDPYQQKIQRKQKQAFLTQSTLIGRKNQTKFENDCVSRNGHRIKITQLNSMILVSFSSAEDALFNDVQNLTFLDRRVLKICRSAFLGTPGISTVGTSISKFWMFWNLK